MITCSKPRFHNFSSSSQMAPENQSEDDTESENSLRTEPFSPTTRETEIDLSPSSNDLNQPGRNQDSSNSSSSSSIVSIASSRESTVSEPSNVSTKLLEFSSSSSLVDKMLKKSEMINSVPRTVPCVVLSPPQMFSPSLYTSVTTAHLSTGVASLPLWSPEDFSRSMAKLAAVARNPFSHSKSITETDQNANSVNFNDSQKFQNNNDDEKCNRKSHFNENHKLKRRMSEKESSEIGENDKLKGSEPKKRLTFGIDSILSMTSPKKSLDKEQSENITNNEEFLRTPISHCSTSSASGQMASHQHHQHHQHPNYLNLSQCSECFFLSRYCRTVQFPMSSSNPSTNPSAAYSWVPTTPGLYEGTAILSPGYPTQQSNYLNSSAYSLVGCSSSSGGGGGRRKRSWSRAVFSNLQRKGLEKRFQIQKYITKPDRRQLAATLGLTDAQVKVWFQNRRMKWRHSKEGKANGTGGTVNTEETTMALPASNSASASSVFRESSTNKAT